MIIGSNIASLIVNHAAASALIGKINTVKKVAHIALVGNTHYSGPNLFGSLNNGSITSRAQLLLLLLHRLFGDGSRGFTIAASSNENGSAN